VSSTVDCDEFTKVFLLYAAIAYMLRVDVKDRIVKMKTKIVLLDVIKMITPLFRISFEIFYNSWNLDSIF
jgi:hypothetical protein